MSSRFPFTSCGGKGLHVLSQRHVQLLHLFKLLLLQHHRQPNSPLPYTWARRLASVALIDESERKECHASHQDSRTSYVLLDSCPQMALASLGFAIPPDPLTTGQTLHQSAAVTAPGVQIGQLNLHACSSGALFVQNITHPLRYTSWCKSNLETLYMKRTWHAWRLSQDY